LPKLIWLGSS